MSEPRYLFYLIGVGRNEATFAVHTLFSGDDPEGIELRIASQLDFTRTNRALELLDVSSIVISQWSEFYRWLGRRENDKWWAAFTKEGGERFVPHWVAESAPYACVKSPVGPVGFVERGCQVPSKALNDIRLFGDAEPEGEQYIYQFNTNLVAATRPIFASS